MDYKKTKSQKHLPRSFRTNRNIRRLRNYKHLIQGTDIPAWQRIVDKHPGSNRVLTSLLSRAEKRKAARKRFSRAAVATGATVGFVLPVPGGSIMGGTLEKHKVAKVFNRHKVNLLVKNNG